MDFTNNATYDGFSCTDQFLQKFKVGTVKKTIWTGEGLDDVRGTISLVCDGTIDVLVTVDGTEKTISLGGNDKTNPYLLTCNNLEKIEALTSSGEIELVFTAVLTYD